MERLDAANVAGGRVFDAFTSQTRILVASHNGEHRVVAVEGENAPGTNDDRVFGSFYETPASINSTGRVAFTGGLYNTDYRVNSGIWTDASGPLEMVVRAGDQAPGGDAEQVFTGFGVPHINALGQIAFSAALTGPDIDIQNDQGIWAQDFEGALQLIAREGDQIEVARNDFRTIVQLAYGFNNDRTGSRQVFNNAGQLVFGALFSDGTSGVFVSNRVAVPEPHGLVMLLISSVVATLRSRSRKDAAVCHGLCR